MTNKTTAEDTLELETINKMFLELSQFTTAKTKREIELESRLNAIAKEVEGLKVRIGNTPAGNKEAMGKFLAYEEVLKIINKHTE